MSLRSPPKRVVNRALLRRWPLPAIAADDGKEERGRVLIVGGSREVPGALLLAATAALRAGAGKLQLATLHDAALPLALHMPEARVIGLPAEGETGQIAGTNAALQEAAAKTDVLLLGPGMSEQPSVRNLVQSLTRECSATMVLDAGGLAGAFVPNPCGPRVLTPHAGEMASLLDCPRKAIEADPASSARELAAATSCVVVLKGHTTWIAGSDGALWVHRGGGPGLGTSGSGDVLSGLLAGLIARGAAAEQAAAWAVFVHAQCGIAAARGRASMGYLARELPAYVPPLLARLSRKPG